MQHPPSYEKHEFELRAQTHLQQCDRLVELCFLIIVARWGYYVFSIQGHVSRDLFFCKAQVLRLQIVFGGARILDLASAPECFRMMTTFGHFGSLVPLSSCTHRRLVFSQQIQFRTIGEERSLVSDDSAPFWQRGMAMVPSIRFEHCQRNVH